MEIPSWNFQKFKSDSKLKDLIPSLGLHTFTQHILCIVFWRHLKIQFLKSKNPWIKPTTIGFQFFENLASIYQWIKKRRARSTSSLTNARVIEIYQQPCIDFFFENRSKSSIFNYVVSTFFYSNNKKQRPYPRSQPQRPGNQLQQRPMAQRQNMNRNGSNGGGQRSGQKRPDSRIYKPHKQYAGTIDTLKKVFYNFWTCPNRQWLEI